MIIKKFVRFFLAEGSDEFFTYLQVFYKQQNINTPKIRQKYLDMLLNIPNMSNKICKDKKQKI